MSRVQLALNVSDLDAAVGFYATMFATEPAKRRPGYANFAITNPPLKLVLIETEDGRGAGAQGALNHLGVEVETAEEVAATALRLADAGLAVSEENQTSCCFALQDKVWAHDPDGAPWETYVVLADAPDAGCLAIDHGCHPPEGAGTDRDELDVPATTRAAVDGCC